MASESDKKRLIYYDLLRIVAAFSVVVLHSAAQFWYTIPVTQTEWKIANTYDALFRFGVPVFVMISGALFLGREVNVKRLYTHNIVRLLVVYLFWSAVYGLFDCRTYDLQETGWRAVVQEIMGGRYHLWFLPMIIGIYILLPILRSWVKNADRKNLQYFLILFIVLKIGRETLYALQQNEYLTYAIDFFNASELSMVCSYIGYFVLGYYLAYFGISRKWHKIIYACVIPSAILNIVLDNYMSEKINAPSGIIYDSFGAFTFVIVVALFLFFTEHMSKVHYNEFVIKVIREVSQATLGIYVMHLLCIEGFELIGIHSMMIPNIIGIPILSIVVFIVCLVCAAIIRRIPFVGKFIC